MPSEYQESTYDLLDVGAGLNAYSRSTERAMDRIKSRVSEITSSFNWRIANKFLDNCLNVFNAFRQITRPVKEIYKTLTVRGLIEGMEEYNNLIITTRSSVLAMARFYTNSVDSMAEATKNVSENIMELNDYADDTIYRFEHMTTAVNKFVQAGLRMDDATSISKGLANLLAYTGNTNPETFENVALAMSRAIQSGKMQLYQWRQMENAGLAGREISEMYYLMAGAMGKDVGSNFEEEFGSLYEQIDGKWKLRKDIEEGDFDSFRDSLSDWLTSDVLANAMTYIGRGSALTEAELAAEGITGAAADLVLKLAREGEEQARTLKTWSQLVDNVQEAAGTAWAEVWMALLGDATKAGEIWTQVGDIFTGDGHNKWGNPASLLYELTQGLNKIVETVDPNAVQQSIILIAKAIDGYSRSILRTLGVDDFESIGKKLGDIINVFSGARELSANAGFLEKAAKRIHDFLEQLSQGKPAPVIRSIIKLLGSLVNVIKKVWEVLSRIVKNIFGGWDGLFDTLTSMLDKFVGVLDKLLNMLGDAADRVGKSVKKMSFSDMVKFLIEGVGLYALFDLVSGIIGSFDPSQIQASANIFFGLAAFLAAVALLSYTDIEKVDKILIRISALIGDLTNLVMVYGMFMKVFPFFFNLIGSVLKFNPGINGGGGGLSSIFTVFGSKGLIAIAVGAIAVSLAVIFNALKDISPEQLDKAKYLLISAGLVLGVALLGIYGLSKTESAASFSPAQLWSIVALIVVLAAAIVAISFAAKLINGASIGAIVGTISIMIVFVGLVIALVVIMGALVAGTEGLGALLVPVLLLIGLAFIELAAAVVMLAFAASLMRSAGAEGVVNLLIALFGSMMALSMFGMPAGQGIQAIATSLVVLALSLFTLVPALYLASTAFDVFGSSLISLGIGFAGLGLGLAAMTNNRSWASMSMSAIDSLSGAQAAGFTHTVKTVFDSMVTGNTGANAIKEAMGTLGEDLGGAIERMSAGMETSLGSLTESVDGISESIAGGFTVTESETDFNALDVARKVNPVHQDRKYNSWVTNAFGPKSGGRGK